MALLAEEVVEEWLNRNGYFTIRGIKCGNDEIDILAFRYNPNGRHECRHIEVQVSTNPTAYISKVPKKIQKARGIGPDNARKRATNELKQGVEEWIAKKFDLPKKDLLRNKLFPGKWSRELVVNKVRHPEELKLLDQVGVNIIRLKDIIQEMMDTKTPIKAAAGNDLLTLMLMSTQDVF